MNVSGSYTTGPATTRSAIYMNFALIIWCSKLAGYDPNDYNYEGSYGEAMNSAGPIKIYPHIATRPNMMRYRGVCKCG